MEKETKLSPKTNTALIIATTIACIGIGYSIYKRPETRIKIYNRNPRKKKPRKFRRILRRKNNFNK